MKNESRNRVGRKAFLSFVAMLAGGTSFTSCDSKVKTAVVGGVKDTFLSLFDPTNFLNTGIDGTNTDGSLNP